ncbi:hypothetical protein Pint_01756 [Pistacia integerrima]|uniref:Uncharacterized protein n=1 Tax=Pistacia integerrima TaxID=434235 RepID=A0ACC0ZKL8_9ROSI|nr:hypothetical protein Pint_01756 [Pistacia integerrima]
MKQQKFNFKFNLFGVDSEIRNVDPKEFNYIVLIKDMKKCVAEENEEVNLFPDKKFREYGLKGVVDIKLFVEALPAQIIESLPAFLEANIGPKTTDTQPQILEQNSFEDKFHWSDVSDEDGGNGGENVQGYVDGVGNVSGDVDAGENVQGEVDGDNGDEDRADSGGLLSDHGHNIEEGDEIGEDDNVSKMSRHVKQYEFKNGVDEKIHSNIGQVFMSVGHFRKNFKDYIIQRGFAMKKVYNEKRRINAIYKKRGMSIPHLCHINGG